jgi:hypothetical protein
MRINNQNRYGEVSDIPFVPKEGAWTKCALSWCISVCSDKSLSLFFMNVPKMETGIIGLLLVFEEEIRHCDFI